MTKMKNYDGILLANFSEYNKFEKLGRNDKCACGSGKKYKKCCINFNWQKDIKNPDCDFAKTVNSLYERNKEREANEKV
tara:strand:+ start:367 stop:603 length:237 start_codon:yes stop_codon:yes gene_type:complete